MSTILLPYAATGKGYGGDDEAILCALVEAQSEDDAKAAVSVSWPEVTPEYEDWRFCEPRGADWLPGDRFPIDKPWMRERLASHADA